LADVAVVDAVHKLNDVGNSAHLGAGKYCEIHRFGDL